jgi:hypothetical protein
LALAHNLYFSSNGNSQFTLAAHFAARAPQKALPYLPQRSLQLENTTATLSLDRQSAQSGTQPIELRGFNSTVHAAGNIKSVPKKVSDRHFAPVTLK